MLENEMLIMVYETLQGLSGGVKDMKAAVQALNMKVESINKRVCEMEGIINDVLNPGIMTIGEGHEAVHKRIYEIDTASKSALRETRETLSEELRETRSSLCAELQETQDALEGDFRTERDRLRSELDKAKDGFASAFTGMRNSFEADMEDIRRDHAELSARLEVYELKQQRLEQELNKRKK